MIQLWGVAQSFLRSLSYLYIFYFNKCCISNVVDVHSLYLHIGATEAIFNNFGQPSNGQGSLLKYFHQEFNATLVEGECSLVWRGVACLNVGMAVSICCYPYRYTRILWNKVCHSNGYTGSVWCDMSGGSR